MKQLKRWYICPVCHNDVYSGAIRQHLYKEHNFSKKQSLITFLSISENNGFSMMERDLKLYYIEKLYEFNQCSNTFSTQIESYYRHIMSVYPKFEKTHIDLFFDKVLPWKLSHPNQSNNKELCFIECNGDNDKALLLYKIEMLEKNPYYHHDGTYSPWSKNFIGYKDMTEEQKKAEIVKTTKSYRDDKLPTQLKYWLNKGYSEEEAKGKVRERQKTFTLEKCIAKYGEERGKQIYEDRQIRWQQTLKSKPIEEQIRINRNKVYRQGSVSKVEQEFLSAILSDSSYHNVYVKGCGIGDLVYGNKLIEFYGDYWHCNPSMNRFKPSYYHPYLHCTAQEKWNLDHERIQKFKDAGFETKIVWEQDYLKNKEQIILECKEFLNVE